MLALQKGEQYSDFQTVYIYFTSNGLYNEVNFQIHILLQENSRGWITPHWQTTSQDQIYYKIVQNFLLRL